MGAQVELVADPSVAEEFIVRAIGVPTASPTSDKVLEILLMATCNRASKAACRAPNSAICNAVNSSGFLFREPLLVGEPCTLLAEGLVGDMGPLLGDEPGGFPPPSAFWKEVMICMGLAAFRCSPISRPNSGFPACIQASCSACCASSSMQLPWRDSRSNAKQRPILAANAFAPLRPMSFCRSSSSRKELHNARILLSRIASRSLHRRPP
mmetsp:Transcript_36639/g.105431  ORF Transcript_36639/g.105431 Transcript_36639/m.105431 type:complete len:210 (+) Transcript_36639:133-762(+)